MIKDELENKTNDIQDIDLSIFNKKKFSINGDTDRIIELDVSDLNILTRIKEQYPRLEELAASISELKEIKPDTLSETELIDETATKLSEVDKEMRKIVDIIFDSNVSEVCVPTGSMYDPINGTFRFEHLINTLIKLYDENLTQEAKKIKANLNKRLNKYKKK